MSSLSAPTFFHDVFRIIDSEQPRSLESKINYFSELLQKLLEPESVQYMHDSPNRNQILEFTVDCYEQLCVDETKVYLREHGELQKFQRLMLDFVETYFPEFDVEHLKSAVN